MIRKSHLILLLLFVQLLVFGQDKLIKDIDFDGVRDSVYVDVKTSCIVAKLSTKGFKAIRSKSIGILNENSGITETRNGFEFFNNWMRAGYENQFRYDPKTKKIQLIGMSRYEFGNAANDGSGNSSVNLLTDDYIGDWNYFDNERELLIKIPTIKTKMKFDRINLEDFSEDTYFNYADRCSGLYDEHKERYMKVRGKVNHKPVFENDSIAIYRIDSTVFYQELQQFPITRDSLPYISDLAEATKQLEGRVEFGAWNTVTNRVEPTGNEGIPIGIHAKNGKKIELKETGFYGEVTFSRYYPTEDIVLFEGGHTSDFSINLKTGEMGAERVGNPYYIQYSPKKLFRVNGYFPGQECSAYFLEQQEYQGSYKYYTAIPMHISDFGFDLCHIEDLFWTSERELYFRNSFFGAQEDRLGFFKLQIKPTAGKIGTINKLQHFLPEGYFVFDEIQGDLNKDGIADLIWIIKDSKEERIVENGFGDMVDRNRRGIMVLLGSNNGYQLAFENRNCFSSENEDGGVYFPPDLWLYVERGNLYVHYGHGRYGYLRYIFRYTDRDFELIGYDSSNNFGPVVNSKTSINYLTKKMQTLTNTNMDAESGEEVFEEKWVDISLEHRLHLSEIMDFDHLSIEDTYSMP